MAGSGIEGMTYSQELVSILRKEQCTMATRSDILAVPLSACLALLLCTDVACQREPQTGELGKSATAALASAEQSEPRKADLTPVSDAFPVEPKHQVVARYFHRTQRCPTCQKISALIEEAVQAGFADDLKSGKVKLQMVDYQDARNQEVTQTYKISDPMLVIMNVDDGKVTEWKLAPKVWALFIKKDAFTQYVQHEIHAYLDGKPASQ